MQRNKRLPPLRWYLLGWFATAAVIMIIAYNSVLDRYLLLGIDLRTESLLEETAQSFERSILAAADHPLPSGENLRSFVDVSQIPKEFRSLFSIESPSPGELFTYLNLDRDNDTPHEIRNTADLCGEENCELIFLYAYRLESGTWLYLLHGLVGSQKIYSEIDFYRQAVLALSWGLMAVFMLLAFLGSRSIDGPLRRLEAWSLSLSEDKPDLKIDNLRFQELDTLANRLRYAFERMRDGMDGEKMFLRHASHELRTPLAILSSNIELIDKLTERRERSVAEQAAFTRQYRALNDIKLLIETLLWINRQSERLPKSEPIDLHQELHVIAEQHRHLLEQRAVSLEITGDTQVLHEPVAAVRIVLSNLIRNAFQYTFDGAIIISVEGEKVTVENTSTAEPDAQVDFESSDEYGFGFGLDLVSRICKQLEWRLSTLETTTGRVTTIQFGDQVS